MTMARPKTHPRKFTALGNLVCPKCGIAMQKLSRRDHCKNCGHEVPWPKGPRGNWIGRLICWTGKRHKGPFLKLDGKFVQCARCGDVYRPGVRMVDPMPPMPGPKPKVRPRPEPDPIERMEIGIQRIDREIASMEAKRESLSIEVKLLETRRDTYSIKLRSLMEKT